MEEDKKLDDYFGEFFDNDNHVTQDNKPSLSPMANKLKGLIEARTVDSYLSWLKLSAESGEVRILNNNDAYVSYNHSLVDKLNGKQFTLLVDNGYDTALYLVSPSWSYEKKLKFYNLRKLDASEKIMSDGSKELTYFIDSQKFYKNKTECVQITKAENCILINVGIITNDKIRLSKRPMIFSFNHTSSVIPRDDNRFQLDNMTDIEKKGFLEGVSSFSYQSIEVDSTIIGIDIETFLPVPKEVYIENGVYKARLELIDGRRYFFFQARFSDCEGQHLSDFEIAKCYLYGKGDFPKDIIKAAEMFQTIGDEESLYWLAHIWLDESHNNVDFLIDGILFLEKAANMGHISAKAELVYYTMKLLCQLPKDKRNDYIRIYMERIKSAVDTALPAALFTVAYIYEKGIFIEKNYDLSFSYYLYAAQAGNLAAKARIGLAPVGNFQDENECLTYFKNSTDKIGFAEYFMGWFLADDCSIMVIPDDIIYFYELAAKSGIVSAIRELGEVYMYENSFVKSNPSKAIMWFEKLNDIDDNTAIELANYYLDGNGCTVSLENDAKAFRLLSETVKKYKNGTAYNNLGWMYKNGRGCKDPDYIQALNLFEKAADLKCGEAYYNLGDIYENGLGVKCNTKTALKYYKQGAELENKKCIEKINNLSITKTLKESKEQVISLLTDIQEQISDINAGTVRMEQKLNQLLNFVENDLSSVIASARLKIHACPEEDDAAVAGFIESTSTYINQTMASPDALVEQETRHLQLLFGNSWGRLLETTRTSLVSAGVLWNSCASITKDNFDFSGICISATSALEAELKRVFYTGFQNFLENRYGKPDVNNWEFTFANWPEKLLSCTQYDFKKSLDKYFRGTQKWQPSIEKGNSFTMGLLPFIFGKPEKFRDLKQERLLQTRLIEYLKTIVSETYVNNPIEAFYKPKDKGCFVEKSECIRKDYRNKAAHVDVVSRVQAEKCYQQVIGKIEAYGYTSDVTGLIVDLYKKLR